MPVAHVTIGAHANQVLNQVLIHVLKYESCAELTLPLSGPEIMDPNNPQHRKAGPTPHYGCGITSSAPHMSRGGGLGVVEWSQQPHRTFVFLFLS